MREASAARPQASCCARTTIATHPDYRRQGIARKLLTYTLQSAMREGVQSSFLEVRESNLAAQDMYRKFGYVEVGRRKRYYRDNNEDAILMNLEKINADRLHELA